MVRNYKRKTKDLWTKEDLLEALQSIKNGTLTKKESALKYKISRATLYRHYSKFIGCEDPKQYLEMMRRCGGNPILSKVEEQALKMTILDLRKKGLQVNSTDVKRICFEYCDLNGVPNQFREDKRLASEDWYFGFLKRNPELRISNPLRKTDKGDADAVDEKSMEKGSTKKASQDALNAKINKKDPGPGGQMKPLKRLSKENVQRTTSYCPSNDEIIHDIIEVLDEVDDLDEVGEQEEEGAEAMDVAEVSEESCKHEVDCDCDEHVSEGDIDETEA